MSRILKSRRAKVLVGVMATMAVAAVAAFAFLTTTGSGSGTSSATASASNITLSNDSADFTALDTSKVVTIKASNPNTSPQAVHSIKVTVTPQTGCPAGSWTVGSSTATSSAATFVDVASDVNVPAAVGTTAGTNDNVGKYTLFLNNDTLHLQNPCFVGSPTIDYAGTATP
jgi:hypothetical protein